MKISLDFFFCSVIYLRYSFAYEASFVDDGDSCVILSPARCTKPCNCKNYITFNPDSWYRAFLSSIKGEKCKCDDCRKAKKVKCKNGVCDTKNQKCVCDYCWIGEVCDKFENKHAPKFESTQLEVSVPTSHPLDIAITTVTAYDRDAGLCNGEKCQCGDVIYKLEEKFGIFSIDKNTGAISMTKTPKKSNYVLQVTANNLLNDEAAKEGKINVKISIFEANPSEKIHLISDNNEEQEEDVVVNDDEIIKHHRFRRSVTVSHPLVITAIPTLDKTYYFNKNEQILFKVKAYYNGTGADITSLTVDVTSVWLTLQNDNITIGSVADRFASSNLVAGKATFSVASISSWKTITGTIVGVVKNDIGPLANLNLDLDAKFTYDSTPNIPLVAKSSPLLYGVYPEVNITKDGLSAATYQSVSIKMDMQLPLLNYRLLVELTTNVECFIFMEIKDVVVQSGMGVTFDGSNTPVNYKSEWSHGLVDRVIIDFGNISVTGDTSGRSITIDYNVGVKDHANVANGSTHYAGAGLQAGNEVLWVDQQNIEITKIEPALEITINNSAIDNSSRLFIGDVINIIYRVDHSSTSEATAKFVKISLVSDFVTLNNGADGITGNLTHSSTSVTDTLQKGQSIKGEFIMTVTHAITPLIQIPLELFVYYENTDGIKKFPLRTNVTTPLTGTPSFTFSRVEGSGDIVFGEILTYELVILVTKMTSPLQVEFVLPKHGNDTENGTALMNILTLDVIQIGENLKDENNNTKDISNISPTLFATSTDSTSKDQAVWDFGTVSNSGSDVSNTSVNQMIIRMTALVNEVQNVSNRLTYKVGAGVIGKPRMVWVGQINATIIIRENRQPMLIFSHTIQDETKDIYQHTIQFNHSANSDQYAYNLTFEYFLPPYVEFVKVVSSSPNIDKVNMIGGRSRFKLATPLTFLESGNHSIQVRLKKEYSPKTGIFDFMVPAALTYNNYEHKRWQYWRSITRGIHVRSKAPIIKKKGDAHSNYYGRGLYVRDKEAEIYVCMNMHLPTGKTACYLSKNAGNTWEAMDIMVGCVIGYHQNHLYAVGRNQVIIMKYDKQNRKWYLINETQKQGMASFFDERRFKDLTDVTTLEPAEILPGDVDASDQWSATDESVFYRPAADKPWEIKAKWRL